MCLREKIGPDPRNFNQRVSLGRNDLLIRTFPNALSLISDKHDFLKILQHNALPHCMTPTGALAPVGFSPSPSKHGE